MKVKLFKNAYVFTNNQEMKKFLNENQDQLLEVDTNYLFDNQYNVEGFRIFDCMIEQIIDDVRTDQNIFFVQHPNNLTTLNFRELNFDKLEKTNLPFEFKYDKGSYDYIASYTSLGYYRVNYKNSCINFKYDYKNQCFWVCNGIGYKKCNSLEKYIISEKRCKKIKDTLNLIYSLSL